MHHYELSSKNCFCCIPEILYGCVFIVICLKYFFLFPFLISSLTHRFFSSMFFSLHVIIFFLISFPVVAF